VVANSGRRARPASTSRPKADAEAAAADRAAPEARPVVNLGARLRAVRQATELSVREAARQLGVSASFVSQLETGKSQPSVATLYSLSQLLDVTIDELFGSDAEFDARLTGHRRGALDGTAQGVAMAAGAAGIEPEVAAVDQPSRSDFASIGEFWPGERQRPKLSVTKPGARPRIVMDSGVVWEQLAANTGSDLDFIEVVYPAGSSSTTDNRMLRHEGYEYGCLIEGELQVTVGFDTFTLRPGDAMGFDSSVPHLFSNNGRVPARGIWCVRHPHE
jgi:transcriptional regulator with XRE-family HTH domain/quercetin dioxygenase-like cupin family protein